MSEKHAIVFGWSKSKNRPRYEVDVTTNPNGIVEVSYEGQVIASGPTRTDAVGMAIGVLQRRTYPQLVQTVDTE